MLKISSPFLRLLPLVTVSLLARDISPKEYEIYTAENYRVDFNKLPKEMQEKVKLEYTDKIKLAQAITVNTVNDPLFNAARDFKTLDVWTNQISAKTLPTITDEKLKELFKKQKLKVAAKYKLRNILVKTYDDAQDIVKKFSGLEGDKLQAKFISYVKDKSLDPATKDKEGDGGWVDISTMPKEIINQFKDKKPSSLVVLPEIKDLGTQIILIEDIKPEHTATFDEAKEFLIKNVIQQAIAEEAKKLLSHEQKRKKER